MDSLGARHVAPGHCLGNWAEVPELRVIDNTNLARFPGMGSKAVMVPEMEAFAKSHSLAFLCHAPKHLDLTGAP
ncbi:MAG: hypothetical protein JNK85_28070 [Verrucomicrobiales bacterium]|nr:hypothetical protein [Verrucomicrobiales bacterium]